METWQHSSNLSERNSAFSHPDAIQMIPANVNERTTLETYRLLAIFPNEIWLQICHEIFQPEDLNNLRRSSPFFEKLQILKPKALFPEAIKTIAAKIPFAAGKLRPLLLKCRLVCRTWEIGVDSFVTNASTNLKLVKPYRGFVFGKPFAGTITRFLKPGKPLEFLQHFDDAYASKNRSPFLGRSVYVHCYNATSQVPFEQLFQILRKYGHHIFNFEAGNISPRSRSVLPEDTTKEEEVVLCYKQLIDMIRLMPNLKGLKIDCLGVSKDAYPALELSMQSCVFPELISLQRLELEEVPACVYDAFLRSYSHVTTLRASWPTINTNYSLCQHQMPNLTKLDLDLQISENLIQLEAANINWSLTSFKIRVHRFNFDCIKFQKLFQIMESRWATTLTELEIRVEQGQVDTSMKVFPSLKLPNLKVFIFYSHYFVSLDFLLPTRNSLEQLQVHYHYRVLQEPYFIQNEEIVKFYTFCSNLRESNIWALFPKLKFLDYYDRHVGVYRISNQRYRKPKSKEVNCFTVEHARTNWPW